MNFIKKYVYQISLTVILSIMFLLMLFSSLGDTNIVDEVAHIPAGYSYLTTRDYRLNPEHPPLIKDIAAFPLLFLDIKYPFEYVKANSPVVNNQWEAGWQFIYKLGNNPDQVVQTARIPMMLLSLLFGYFVYRWASELYGKKAGLFALVLYAFNANIIAHSRFVTTDLGISFAFFLNMYFLYKYLKEPSWKRLIFTGITFFIVLITKFSAAVLVPTYFVVWIMIMLKKGNKSPKLFLEKFNDKKWLNRGIFGLVSFIIIGLIGVTLMWLFYVPHTISMPSDVQKALIEESGVGIFTQPLVAMSGNPITKPIAQWLLGFSMVSAHVEGGHDAFLLGQVSNKGWWYYYPVTIAIKTQIPIFIFLILTLIFWKKLERNNWFNELYLWTLPIVLIAMGMQGSINLGIRYMLPIYAFIFLFVSRLANVLTIENLKIFKDNLSNFLLSWVIVLSLVWYVLSAFMIYPHFLSYYNEFIGGYKNGYKYLTDSNTDWGQDIKRLNQWTVDNNVKLIYVDVFPGAFQAKQYLGDKMVEWHVQDGRPTGYFAVSATFYQNSRLKKGANGGIDYSWLDSMTPIENIGGSILIYKVD